MGKHVVKMKNGSYGIVRRGYIPTIGTQNVYHSVESDKVYKGPVKWFRKISQNFFTKNTKFGRDIIANPGSWKCLVRIYEKKGEKKLPGSLFDKIFLYSKASKATRDRLKVYQDQLRQLSVKYAQENGGQVEVLDLASGSGYDMIDTLSRMDGIDLKATFIDKDPHALGFSRKIAGRHRLSSGESAADRIEFIEGDILEMVKFNGGRYNIIVSQGFLDYLTPEESVEFLGKVKGAARSGATILTSNMKHSTGMKFTMEFFGGWNLNYKTDEQMKEIMERSGFSNIEILNDKYGMHSIAKATVD